MDKYGIFSEYEDEFYAVVQDVNEPERFKWKQSCTLILNIYLTKLKKSFSNPNPPTIPIAFSNQYNLIINHFMRNDPIVSNFDINNYYMLGQLFHKFPFFTINKNEMEHIEKQIYFNKYLFHHIVIDKVDTEDDIYLWASKKKDKINNLYTTLQQINNHFEHTIYLTFLWLLDIYSAYYNEEHFQQLYWNKPYRKFHQSRLNDEFKSWVDIELARPIPLLNKDGTKSEPYWPGITGEDVKLAKERFERNAPELDSQKLPKNNGGKHGRQKSIYKKRGRNVSTCTSKKHTLRIQRRASAASIAGGNLLP